MTSLHPKGTSIFVGEKGEEAYLDEPIFKKVKSGRDHKQTVRSYVVAHLILTTVSGSSLSVCTTTTPTNRNEFFVFLNVRV